MMLIVPMFSGFEDTLDVERLVVRSCCSQRCSPYRCCELVVEQLSPHLVVVVAVGSSTAYGVVVN